MGSGGGAEIAAIAQQLQSNCRIAALPACRKSRAIPPRDHAATPPSSPVVPNIRSR